MRYVGALGYVRALGGAREPVVYVGGYGGVEDEDNEAFQEFGYTLYGGRVGGSFELYARVRAFASVSIEQRDFDGEDPIFLVTRDDTQIIATTGLEYVPAEAWRVRPNISYINSDSNIPLSDYDRLIAGVDVTWRF
jgi:hypothetical protein